MATRNSTRMEEMLWPLTGYMEQISTWCLAIKSNNKKIINWLKIFKLPIMKRILSLVLLGALLTVSCRKIEVDGSDNNNNNGGNNPPPTENTILSGTIKSDITLKAANVYTLRGIVYVAEGA